MDGAGSGKEIDEWGARDFGEARWREFVPAVAGEAQEQEIGVVDLLEVWKRPLDFPRLALFHNCADSNSARE